MIFFARNLTVNEKTLNYISAIPSKRYRTKIKHLGYDNGSAHGTIRSDSRNRHAVNCVRSNTKLQCDNGIISTPTYRVFDHIPTDYVFLWAETELAFLRLRARCV